MNAQLNIETGLRKDKTFLKDLFFSQPYKIANISEDVNDPTLYLMLMSSSPGVLDNDNFYIQISVVANTSLSLRTQSFQRLFSMKESATQKVNVTVNEHASFTFISHPAVPHKQSSFTNHNLIKLQKTSRLIWGEILTCGRKSNGEIFHFTQYQSITEVFVSDKLLLRENLFLVPAEDLFNQFGQLEGFTHQAVLIFIDEHAPIKELMDEVYNFLGNNKSIEFGITQLNNLGFVIKLLGNYAEELFKLLNSININFLTNKNICRI
ncbi:MAG: urease accessory protein UreD [Ginsengibacter sp.]